MGVSTNIYTQNYYELFDVAENASAMEIKHAYARLIRQYSNETHPEEFMHIREAFQILSNPSLRSDYDQQLHGQTQDYSANEQSYNQSNDHYSYNDETTYSNDNSYSNQYSYEDDYTSNYDGNYQQGYHQEYQQTSQQYEQAATQPARKSGNYSLLGNIIFSIIVSLFFTPVTGLITGLVIHFFKIPISRILGCLFWIVIAIIVLYFITS